MNWSNICFHQKLTLPFLIEHTQYLELDDVYANNNIPQEIRDQFKILMVMGV
jgi:hypothetical protein